MPSILVQLNYQTFFGSIFGTLKNMTQKYEGVSLIVKKEEGLVL